MIRKARYQELCLKILEASLKDYMDAPSKRGTIT